MSTFPTAGEEDKGGSAGVGMDLRMVVVGGGEEVGRLEGEKTRRGGGGGR